MFTYVLIVLLALFLFSIYIMSSLKDYFYSRERVGMFTKANVVASAVTARGTIASTDIATATKDLLLDTPMRLLVLDTQTMVLYDNDTTNSIKGKLFINDTIKSALLGEDSSSIYQNKDGTHSMDVAVPVVKDGEMVGIIYLRRSLQDVGEFLRDTQTFLITLSVIIIILIAVLSALLTGAATSPLIKLTQVADSIAAGNFNQRVEVHGRDEIARLGEAFNTMSQRLVEFEKKHRTFVSDASHELKTPLATIKLFSESILQSPDIDPVMVKEFLEDMNNEVDRLTRIIDRLLALTRSDSPHSYAEFETVNVNQLLEVITRKLRPLAKEKGIELNFSYDLEDEIEMLLDKDKIYEAVYNIVDNSIKYTEEGGHVNVLLTTDLNSVIIEVEDSGIGIPRDETGRIFDRFYRVDKARARDTGGTGLGLSIASEAINLHGGHIEVISEEGKGSRFIIVLPYAGK